MSEKYRPCRFRKNVDGIDMCYAIGCCEIGDMPCECPGCDRPCDHRVVGEIKGGTPMDKEELDSVDEFENGLRKIEGELEKLGRSICSKTGGDESWGAVSRAVEAVQDAIRSTYKMRDQK